ncbi:MAG: sensor histidine kinase [Actinomycetota bacterium]
MALIANASHARTVIRRDPVAGEVAVAELQDGLQRVNTELRELAHGIHPSVLGDRGLLEAVEALAARSSVPVAVRADPSLRGERFAEEVEGASYFTVAEALANVIKHAAATRAEVRLARSDDALRIAVHDDGEGFDLATAVGEGLANLAERLAALGGRLDVVSTPGQGTTVTAQLRVSGA